MLYRTRHDLLHDAIDRELTGFERGTMDEERVADRLTELRAKRELPL